MTIIRLMGGSKYWLVLMLATYCSCYDLCSKNKNCSCQEIEWRTWLVECYRDGYLEFDVGIHFGWFSYSVLRCNQSVSSYDAEFRLAKPIDKTGGILTVSRCSLPDESFGTISQRLGIKKTMRLVFSSYQKLGRSLTRRHFSGLSKLRLLDLSENGLTELTDDLLRDVPNLKRLSLTSNKITSLPCGIFEGLMRLEDLDLADNKIEVIDSMLFRNCTALSRLNVTNNLLTTLDHRIFDGLLDFNSLILDDNPLEITSNDVFESLPGLQILCMSGCQFSSLSDGLFRRLESLKKVKLCDNRWNSTTLPKRLFNNTTSSFDVYLERNRFSRLSEDTFWGGIQLRRLILTGNAFTTLPVNIFSDSAKLVLLDLSDNGLTNLPDGLFRGLTRLTNLSLSHNRITSLSELLFADLYSLRELDLSFNQISQVRASFFKNLRLLRIARFTRNSIRFPEDGQYLFQYCVSLEKLFLDYNNFTRLSISKWDDQVAPTLQLVDLSFNRLTTFEVENELPKSRRVVFDLRHNYVQQLPIQFWSIAELSFMLDDNPIHCDCNLYEWNYPAGQIRPTLYDGTLTMLPGNAKCASPEWMYGIRIADVDWTSFLCHPSQKADEYIRCADECDCWWRPSDHMRVVNCSSRNLTTVPDRLMEFSHVELHPFFSELWSNPYAWRGNPTELRFEKNRFTEIPLFNESIYESVVTIFLSFNNFSVVSRILLPPNLQVLRLDHCNLTRFRPAALAVVMNANNLREVNLDENPWDCHRDTRNALLAIDDKFERVTKYAGGEHICLDPGRVRHSGKEHQLYISYIRF